MIYKTMPPSPVLAEFVRFYWVLESDEAYTHHGMASVCPEMVFHYRGRFDELGENGSREKSFLAGLSGQSSAVRRFKIDQGFGIFGIYLYPDAVSRLFGIHAAEFTDQMPDLASLMGAEGRSLEARILAATSNAERLRLVEAFLVERLRRVTHERLPVFAAIRELIHRPGPLSVRALADRYALSERQLGRQFLQYAGFSPKKFQRIARFHHALEHYGAVDRSLAEIALDCGYYDQAHFCADFRQFSGTNPSIFFSRTSESTLWREA